MGQGNIHIGPKHTGKRLYGLISASMREMNWRRKQVGRRTDEKNDDGKVVSTSQARSVSRSGALLPLITDPFEDTRPCGPERVIGK